MADLRVALSIGLQQAKFTPFVRRGTAIEGGQSDLSAVLKDEAKRAHHSLRDSRCMVGTALARLCPPYGFFQPLQFRRQIASTSATRISITR